MQVGVPPDHCPSGWQYLVVTYEDLKPALQVYVAVLPKASPELSATLPLAGLLRLGHESAAKKQEQHYDYVSSKHTSVKDG